MRFQNYTIGQVKSLFMEKVVAKEKKDSEKLHYLENTYPELFNAKFLMDLLRNEFDREKKGLTDDIIMQYYLFSYQ
jgi:hypothetical protein